MAKCGTHAYRKEVFVIRMVLTFSTFNLHKGNESRAEKNAQKGKKESKPAAQTSFGCCSVSRNSAYTVYLCLCNICRLECCLRYYYYTLHVRQVVHIIHQGVDFEQRLIFLRKGNITSVIHQTPQKKDSGQLFIFDFLLKRWRKERTSDCG